MNDIIQTVKKVVQKNHLFEADDTLLVAVSGGCDSVFLLRSLYLLKDDLNINLKAAHLNHMLREDEAERDAAFVKDLCAGLSVECFTDSIDTEGFAKENHLSIEEAARVCRYDFLERVRQETGADRVVLGHTADDQAETLLLHLFRGTGTTGLSAMSEKRGYIIRPLLIIRRNEIRDYLDENGYTYVDDSSNLDLRFRRNVIRHKVIPLIASCISPSVVPILARTASVLSEEDALLEAGAQRDLSDASRVEGDKLVLDITTMEKMEPARKRRLLRAAIRAVKGDLRNIGSVHINDVAKLVHSGSAGTTINIHSLEVYRDYESIILGKRLSTSVPRYERPVNIPGTTFVEEADLSLESSFSKPADAKFSGNSVAYFDFDELALPISVRNRRPGDRLVPFAKSSSKKLKEIFIDDKLPRRERDLSPIIVDRGGILWVPGGRRSNRAPITPKTERILCIEARQSPD